MPDIISRIRLEATGADQVAREINKIKEAYDDTAESAQGVSRVTMGGAPDPFTQATQRGGAAGPETTVLARQERSRLERDSYDRRMTRHYTSGGGETRQQGAWGQMMQTMRQTTGTAGAAQAADVQGVTAGGGGLIAGLLKINPIIALLAVAAGTLGIAVKKEFENMKALYDPGITRRLGETYRDVRERQVEMGRAGIPLPEVNALLSSLGAAGGRMTPEMFRYDEAGLPVGMAERMGRYGIDPGVMGQFMATTQRAGYTGTAERNMQLMARTFGVGRTGQGLEQAAQMLEEAMTRGARKGSIVLEEGAGRILREAAAFGQLGGFSMEGAFGLVRKLETGVVTGARPKTPLQVMTLRAVMQGEDLNLFQAQEWIERNQTAARDYQFKVLQGATTDRSVQARMLAESSNLTFAEAGTAIDLMRKYGPTLGARGEGPLRETLEYGERVVPDETMLLIKRGFQQQILAGLGAGSLEAIAAFFKKLLGIDITFGALPEPGTAEYDALIEALQKETEAKTKAVVETKRPLKEEELAVTEEGRALSGAEQAALFLDMFGPGGTVEEAMGTQTGILERIEKKMPGEGQ